MTGKLHDDILDKLPPDFVRRMLNWARDRDGGRISTAFLGERVDGWMPEVPIPTLRGEAADTHKALLTLPQKYQEAVVVFWSYNVHTIAWMCSASPRMRLWNPAPAWFRDWLDRGHEMLQSELAKGKKERRTA